MAPVKPRPKRSKVRNKTVTISLSEEEFAMIRKFHSGLKIYSFSEWVRGLIFKAMGTAVPKRPSRWELLKALGGAGPVSIREAARRVKRDVKAVHGDVTALLNAGLLNRVDDGRIEFPYDAVKVEFMLKAA